MKLLIICSKQFYPKIEEIKDVLKIKGFEVYFPNCYDAPETEQKMWDLGKEEHQKFKAQMYRQSEELIKTLEFKWKQ